MVSPGKIALLVGLVLSLVWQHVEATRIGYRVENSRRQIVRLRAENAGLRRELESRLAPAQLALNAEKRLGMILANPESLRILDSLESPRLRRAWAVQLTRLWRSYSRRLPGGIARL